MPDNNASTFLNLQKQQSLTASVKVAGFLRAWVAGTIAGGAPFAAVFLWQAIEWQSLESLTLILIPLAVAGIVSLLGMLLIALPATALLRSHRAETVREYCAIGLVGGAVLACAVTFVFFVPIPVDEIAWQPFAFFGGTGAIAGLAASFVWGRHRTNLHQIDEATQSRHANPILELLH